MHRAAAALSVLSVLIPSPRGALAQTSSYCRKVSARADQEAALLAWPRLVVEGYRFPTDTSSGPTVHGIQPRVGLSFSPTDLLQGVETERVARAECQLHDAATALQEWVADTNAAVELRGLEAQVEYLAARRHAWEEIRAESQARLDSGLITIVDQDNLRRQADVLERKLEAQRTLRDRLRAEVRVSPTQRGDGLAALVLQRSRALEREGDHLVALGAWQVRLMASVIPIRGATDWLGRVEVTYSLGSLGSGGAVARHQAASDEELRNAPEALPSRARALAASLQARRAGTLRQLEVVERELDAMEATRSALESSQATSAAYEAATLALEAMLLDSERAYLRAIVDAIPAGEP